VERRKTCNVEQQSSTRAPSDIPLADALCKYIVRCLLCDYIPGNAAGYSLRTAACVSGSAHVQIGVPGQRIIGAE
jgi:hypothetical protein